MADSGDVLTDIPPGGGRCMRARKLARARAAGEELSDFEERALDAHLESCERCSAYVAEFSTDGGADVSAEAQAGEEDADEAEAAGTAASRGGSGEDREERGERDDAGDESGGGGRDDRDESGGGARDEDEDANDGGDEDEERSELPPAPSLGPNTKLVPDRDPEEVEERKSHRSDTDAMGQDKKRQVVGHSYGPSRSRQLLYYGIFLGFVIALYLGAQVAIGELDQPPANNPDVAPWSAPDAPQVPPQRFQ